MGTYKTAILGLGIVSASLFATQAMAQGAQKPDCSKFTKLPNGAWLLTGPIEWKPYVVMVGPMKMKIGKGGMNVNGKDMFDAVEESCGGSHI